MSVCNHRWITNKSSRAFPQLPQPGQIAIDRRRILVSYVNVQRRNPWSLRQWRGEGFNFFTKYRHWIPAKWRKVMFNYESTFALMKGVPNMLRTASRYDSQFTDYNVRHYHSVMVWGAFSGNVRREGWYFIPKDVTMKGSNYMYTSKEYLFRFWRIHQCDQFMHVDVQGCRNRGDRMGLDPSTFTFSNIP